MFEDSTPAIDNSRVCIAKQCVDRCLTCVLLVPGRVGAEGSARAQHKHTFHPEICGVIIPSHSQHAVQYDWLKYKHVRQNCKYSYTNTLPGSSRKLLTITELVRVPSLDLRPIKKPRHSQERKNFRSHQNKQTPVQGENRPSRSKTSSIIST